MSKGKTAVIVALIVVILGLVGAGMFFAGQDHIPWIDQEAQRSVEPMEVRGRWLGMTIGALDSPVARDWAIPTEAQGVLVLDIDRSSGWRALRGGVEPGDVIVGIDGSSVYDMSGFYDTTRGVDVADVVLLDVMRGGQVMTLALPAASAIAETPATPAAAAAQLQAAVPALGGPEVRQVAGAQQAVGGPLYQGPPGPGLAGPQGLAYQGPFGMGQGGGQGGGLGPGQGQGRGFGRGQGAAGGAGATGPFYVCPRHGTRWNRGAVYPSFRCPRCNGPLQQVP